MARPRKPTNELKLHGQYQPSRHGDRAAEPQPKGRPVKPSDLSEDASLHWDAIVPGLIDTEVATGADTAALAAMCNWHAEYMKALRITNEDRKRLMMMVAAHKEWVHLASRFGLTPVDRARIQVGQKEDYDPVAKYIS